jgi:hypothetical protein
VRCLPTLVLFFASLLCRLLERPDLWRGSLHPCTLPTRNPAWLPGGVGILMACDVAVNRDPAR